MDRQIRAEVERLVADALASGEFIGPGGIIDDRVYSKPETVELLRVAPRTFDYMLERGEAPRVIQLSKRRIAFLGRDIRSFVEKRARMYEPPSFEERQTIGLEVVAMIEAARDRDFERLTEITHGSDTPVWKHAVEAVVEAAWLVEHCAEFDSADEAMARLRRRVATEAD
jgi:predicted DNA-binding transcriptional regulator AlpA